MDLTQDIHVCIYIYIYIYIYAELTSAFQYIHPHTVSSIYFWTLTQFSVKVKVRVKIRVWVRVTCIELCIIYCMYIIYCKYMKNKVCVYIYIYSAVKRLIAINRIQNKGFCLRNIHVCTVYIYYVYINMYIHTCTYIFKINVMFIY